MPSNTPYSSSYEGILDNDPTKIVPQSRLEVLMANGYGGGGGGASSQQIVEIWNAINTLNGNALTEGSVEKKVTDKIAEVIANAPEDLNTLKEIADWIADHAEDAAEMNQAISEAANWTKYS